MNGKGTPEISLALLHHVRCDWKMTLQPERGLSSKPNHTDTLINLQPSKQGEIHFCHLEAIQSMVLCPNSLN